MARIAFLGLGYVGLVTGAVFAERGHSVIGYDVDPKKIDMVNRGESPIHEPGLSEMLKANSPARFRATSDLTEVMDNSDFIFIAVGTPSREDGSIDLRYIESAVKEVASQIRKGQIVVVKSTVVPGTTAGFVRPILDKCDLGPGDYGLAVNPEFLREGMAVEDALRPSRVVIGAEDPVVSRRVSELYYGNDAHIYKTDLTTAEMIKYASNALLAVKISFANEMSLLCEKLGIDVYDVMDGVGMDPRLSPYFLNAGLGYGGSCLPKDTKALKHVFVEREIEPFILNATETVNEFQPLHAVELLDSMLGGLDGRRIALLGLAFKPETDDVRETRAVPVVEELLARGAEVAVHDPIALQNFREYGFEIEYSDSAENALQGSHGLIIQTAWRIYARLELESFKRMNGRAIIDGRRALRPTQMDFLLGEGFNIKLIGRGC